LIAPRFTFDVMLGAYVLGAGERNHDLPSVAERFAGITLMEEASPIDQFKTVLGVFEAVRAAVRETGLEKVLQRFDLPLVPVLAHMEEAGILIDRKYLLALDKELAADRIQVEQDMVQMAGRAFNPGSPSQLAEILFIDLKLPTKGIKKGKTGFSTASSELEKLRGQHPMIEKIADYRELSKLLSTYVEVLPLLAD
jgi:DNA polymerase-1